MRQEGEGGLGGGGDDKDGEPLREALKLKQRWTTKKEETPGICSQEVVVRSLVIFAQPLCVVYHVYVLRETRSCVYFRRLSLVRPVSNKVARTNTSAVGTTDRMFETQLFFLILRRNTRWALRGFVAFRSRSLVALVLPNWFQTSCIPAMHIYVRVFCLFFSRISFWFVRFVLAQEPNPYNVASKTVYYVLTAENVC